MKRMVLIGGLMTSLLTGGVALAQQPGDVYAPEAYRHGGERGGWTRLGQVHAGGRRDRDLIQVGREAGRMARLMIVAHDPVFVRALRVTFMNGETAELDVRNRFDRGSRSAAIDLPGHARGIQSIELLARGHDRSRRWGRGGARVEIWGENARRAGPYIGGGGGGQREPVSYQQGWQSLGTTSLTGRRDADTLHVGLDQGRFRQLMIVFHEGEARLQGVAVTFGNGETATLPVRSQGRDLIVDLPGEARGVRAVTLVGGGAGYSRGGRVEVLGM